VKWLLAPLLFLMTTTVMSWSRPITTVREPGRHEATLAAGDEVGQQGRFAHCYLLDTRKGERWHLAMRPGVRPSAVVALQLYADSLCEGTPLMGHAATFTNRADLSFVAGGGVYAVEALGLQGGGSYTLEFSRASALAASGFVEPGPAFTERMAMDWKPVAVSSLPSDRPGGLVPGTVFRDCEDACPDMVVVPAGHFLMGSPSDEEGRGNDESPRHEVRIARAFAVGKYEITHAEYAACVADGMCKQTTDGGWGGGRRPVIGVSWYDALDYAIWLSRKTGQTYQLLSEAEWEYAARAGTTTPWSTGSAIVVDDANSLDQFKQPVPVGGYPSNALGLHDMHGNAPEWVLDCHDVGYFDVPTDGGVADRERCEARGVRGGGWNSEPVRLRSAFRGHGDPTLRFIQVGELKRGMGLRVARLLQDAGQASPQVPSPVP